MRIQVENRSIHCETQEKLHERVNFSRKRANTRVITCLIFSLKENHINCYEYNSSSLAHGF